MGLFTQEITVGLSNPDYILEKVSVPLKKNKIDLIVKNGTIAFVEKVQYKGRPQPYPVDVSTMGARKKDEVTVFLFPDKTLDSVLINFFAGQHTCSLSFLPKMKAKFSIVGSVEVLINDYIFLAEHYNKSLTKDELVDDINNTYRKVLGDEIAESAKKFIGPETTENDLHARLNDISRDVFKGGRRAARSLNQIGLIISPSSVTMHVNTLDETDEQIAAVMDKINKYALDSLDDEKNDKEYARQKEERDTALQHELDMERAKRTAIHEQKSDATSNSTSTTNINNNGTGTSKVVINNTETHSSDKFCISCGNKLPKAAVFCSKCGAKQ